MDDGVSWITGVCIFFILLVIDIIFYGFGSAIQSINENAVEKKADEGDRRSIRLLSLINDPSSLITTIHIAVTFVSIIIGAIDVLLLRNLIYSNIQLPQAQISFFITDLVILCLFVSLILIFGIIIPKKIAAKKSYQWAYSLINLVVFFTNLFKPFIFIVTSVSNIFISLFGIDPNDNTDDVTEEEIMSMVNEGHEQGVLLASEAEMINNIFELGDKNAKDIMIHRKNIIAIDGSLTLDEVLDFILEQNYSRFPVFDKDIDNIIGILHLKDIMIEHKKGINNNITIKNIQGLIREVSFIPETRDLNILFKNMQNTQKHIVIVVDEYGQTAGIVAMEDILEEIVGNILDEYDEDFDMIEKHSDDTYTINGMAPLEDVVELLDIDLSEEESEYDTLNGLLISLIDKIPSENDNFEIKYKGYVFKVISVDNKMINEVNVRKLQSGTEQEHYDGINAI